MFKRARWLSVGFGLGVGTSVVAARKAKRQVERYRPDAVVGRVSGRVADAVARLRDEVAAAVDDGRSAARAREAELLARAPIARLEDEDRAVPFGNASPDR
jgi:hypothetical protein